LIDYMRQLRELTDFATCHSQLIRRLWGFRRECGPSGSICCWHTLSWDGSLCHSP
jgi:hypothetical protein